MAEPKRLFLAIQLQQEHRVAFSAYRKKCQKLDVRWTPLPKLHITVLFIGSTPEELINELCLKLNTTVSNCKPFKLTFLQFTLMPEQDLPRMIWAEFRSSEAYNALVEQLKETVSSAHGAWKPESSREMRPHVTLARFEKKSSRPKLSPPGQSTPALDVRSIDLVESTLSHHGSSYRVLKTFGLSESRESNEKA